MTLSRHLIHSRMFICLSATLLGHGGFLHNIDLQWPNWAKNTGCPVKFEFQINKYNFSIDMSHAIFETYLHWKENLLPSGHPTEIPRSPSPVRNNHTWKHWSVPAYFWTMVPPLQSTLLVCSLPPSHRGGFKMTICAFSLEMRLSAFLSAKTCSYFLCCCHSEPPIPPCPDWQIFNMFNFKTVPILF